MFTDQQIEKAVKEVMSWDDLPTANLKNVLIGVIESYAKSQNTVLRCALVDGKPLRQTYNDEDLHKWLNLFDYDVKLLPHLKLWFENGAWLEDAFIDDITYFKECYAPIPDECL